MADSLGYEANSESGYIGMFLTIQNAMIRPNNPQIAWGGIRLLGNLRPLISKTILHITAYPMNGSANTINGLKSSAPIKLPWSN